MSNLKIISVKKFKRYQENYLNRIGKGMGGEISSGPPISIRDMVDLFYLYQVNSGTIKAFFDLLGNIPFVVFSLFRIDTKESKPDGYDDLKNLTVLASKFSDPDTMKTKAAFMDYTTKVLSCKFDNITSLLDRVSKRDASVKLRAVTDENIKDLAKLLPELPGVTEDSFTRILEEQNKLTDAEIAAKTGIVTTALNAVKSGATGLKNAITGVITGIGSHPVLATALGAAALGAGALYLGVDPGSIASYLPAAGNVMSKLGNAASYLNPFNISSTATLGSGVINTLKDNALSAGRNMALASGLGYATNKVKGWFGYGGGISMDDYARFIMERNKSGNYYDYPQNIHKQHLLLNGGAGYNHSNKRDFREVRGGALLEDFFNNLYNTARDKYANYTYTRNADDEPSESLTGNITRQLSGYLPESQSTVVPEAIETIKSVPFFDQISGYLPGSQSAVVPTEVIKSVPFFDQISGYAQNNPGKIALGAALAGLLSYGAYKYIPSLFNYSDAPSGLNKSNKRYREASESRIKKIWSWLTSQDRKKNEEPTIIPLVPPNEKLFGIVNPDAEQKLAQIMTNILAQYELEKNLKYFLSALGLTLSKVENEDEKTILNNIFSVIPNSLNNRDEENIISKIKSINQGALLDILLNLGFRLNKKDYYNRAADVVMFPNVLCNVDEWIAILSAKQNVPENSYIKEVLTAWTADRNQKVFVLLQSLVNSVNSDETVANQQFLPEKEISRLRVKVYPPPDNDKRIFYWVNPYINQKQKPLDKANKYICGLGKLRKSIQNRILDYGGGNVPKAIIRSQSVKGPLSRQNLATICYGDYCSDKIIDNNISGGCGRNTNILGGGEYQTILDLITSNYGNNMFRHIYEDLKREIEASGAIVVNAEMIEKNFEDHKIAEQKVKEDIIDMVERVRLLRMSKGTINVGIITRDEVIETQRLYEAYKADKRVSEGLSGSLAKLLELQANTIPRLRSRWITN